MEWMAIIGNSIQYIEEHITEEISVDSIAKHVNVSTFYFQKGFSMLCGFTVAEYIRNRRLALAGNDLLVTDEKIMKKEAFTVIANAKEFPYEGAKEVIPQFWQEHFQTGKPAFDWAVFPCRGVMPNALQDVNVKIYTEWLSALKEYEFAAGYCVEYYDDPTKYEKETMDDNYYCEIWIPVKRK